MTVLPDHLSSIWSRLERGIVDDIRRTRRRRRHQRAAVITTFVVVVLTTSALAASGPQRVRAFFAPDDHAAKQVSAVHDADLYIDPNTKDMNIRSAVDSLESMASNVDVSRAQLLLHEPDMLIAIAPTDDGRLCQFTSNIVPGQFGGGSGGCRKVFTSTQIISPSMYASHTEPSWVVGVLPDGIKKVWVIADSGRRAAKMHTNAFYWKSAGVDFPHSLEALLADGSTFRLDFPPPSPDSEEEKWEQQHGTPAWRKTATHYWTGHIDPPPASATSPAR